MAQLKNTTINDTGFLQLPVGTTAQRPSPAAGQMRFNTNAGKAEFYNSAEAAWVPTLNRGVIATGGVVYDADVEGTTFRVHVFTSTGNSTFTVTRGGPVEYLIVAGGGGGTDNCGAGGGAGGLLTGTVNVTPQAYTTSVGAGGSGTPQAAGTAASNGQNSLAFGFTAIGGGAGGQTNQNGFAGGSGGGGKRAGSSGGAGTAGQGNAGGSSNGTCTEGSGGGAGSVGGSNGNPGGIGISSSISGTAQFYAGGGSSGSSGIFSQGGLGGGGSATENGPFQNIANGTPNTGGGGAGGAAQSAQPSNAGGAGGSGIVIIRYPLRQENPVVAAGKTIGDGIVLDLDFAKPTVYAGTGTVVNDSRLNGLNATTSNSPGFVSPRTHRSGFNFVSTSSQQIITNIPLASLPALSNFTLETWVNITSIAAGANNNGVIFGATYYAGVAIYWRSTGSTFTTNGFIRGSDAYRVTSSHTMTLNTPTHLLLTNNNSAGTLNFYVNGTLLSSVPTATQQYASSEAAVAGNIGINRPQIDGGGSVTYTYFNGVVYKANIYNRALSASEVAQQYNATRWRFGV